MSYPGRKQVPSPDDFRARTWQESECCQILALGRRRFVICILQASFAGASGRISVVER